MHPAGFFRPAATRPPTSSLRWTFNPIPIFCSAFHSITSDRGGNFGSHFGRKVSPRARSISPGPEFRKMSVGPGRATRRNKRRGDWLGPVAQSSHMPLARPCCIFLLFSAGLAAQKQPFDVQALLKIARIEEPQLSPDGKTVAFTVQTVDLAQNTKPKQIYTVAVAGGLPLQITTQGTDNERPEWSPDSSHIAFISDRAGLDQRSSSQVWIMKADGSEARQVTNLSTEAGGVLFSPDGKKLIFTSNVYPDCPDDACNKNRLDAEKNNKVKARSYTTLLYRH